MISQRTVLLQYRLVSKKLEETNKGVWEDIGPSRGPGDYKSDGFPQHTAPPTGQLSLYTNTGLVIQ